MSSNELESNHESGLLLWFSKNQGVNGSALYSRDEKLDCSDEEGVLRQLGKNFARELMDIVSVWSLNDLHDRV